MTDIQDMVDRLSDWAEETATEFDGVIHLYASEGNRGMTIGRREDVPQVIFLEFADADSVNETITDAVELELLQMTNGTGWEVVDEDGVYEGNIGEISIARDVPPEDANRTQHHVVAERDFE